MYRFILLILFLAILINAPGVLMKAFLLVCAMIVVVVLVGFILIIGLIMTLDILDRETP